MQGGAGPPFRNPPSFRRCWGRLRRIASRLHAASVDLGRRTHTPGRSPCFRRPLDFLELGAGPPWVQGGAGPPFRNPPLFGDVGGASGASLRVCTRRPWTWEDGLTHPGGALVSGDPWISWSWGQAPPGCKRGQGPLPEPPLGDASGGRPPFRNPPSFSGRLRRLRRIASRLGATLVESG